ANGGRRESAPVRPLSTAAPIAGTCEQAMPALMRAISGALRDAAIARRRATAGDHHVAIGLLAHAGHLRGEVLEGESVGRADLGEEVDIAAELDHPVVVAREHRVA